MTRSLSDNSPDPGTRQSFQESFAEGGQVSYETSYTVDLDLVVVFPDEGPIAGLKLEDTARFSDMGRLHPLRSRYLSPVTKFELHFSSKPTRM